MLRIFDIAPRKQQKNRTPQTEFEGEFYHL